MAGAALRPKCWLGLLLVLVARIAAAQLYVPNSMTWGFPGNLILYDQSPPLAPLGGQEELFGQAGSGVCAKDSTGTVRCTGGGGTGYTLALGAPGVDCTGATASGTGFQTLLNGFTSTGGTVLLSSGCKIGLASPGAGGVALTTPGNIRILCADQSAGFFAQEQFCTGGTFGPTGMFGIFGGSNCNTNADCPGGGTCVSSFGAGAGAACTAATCFAPTSGSTYTMFQAAPNASNIWIENCSFWANQADPFQRCVGGTNAGFPCRQECALGSALSGGRCDTNADCVTGTCDLSKMNCTTGGGSCTGAPQSPSGPGNINVMNFGAAQRVYISNVAIFDHNRSAPGAAGVGISAGAFSTIVNTNVARELTDCTSPFSTPTDSQCFIPSAAGLCCYGASNNVFAAANKANTQPALAVTRGVNTGSDSQLIRVNSHGTERAIIVGDRSRIDESAVIPQVVLSNASVGPDTPSNGFQTGMFGIVAKSLALDLIGSGTCINLPSDNSGAIGNKCSFDTAATGGIGINSTGNQAHVVSNLMVLSGTSTGIVANGRNGLYNDNNISGLTGTAIGIDVGASGVGDVIGGNSITGNGTGNFVGMQLEVGSGSLGIVNNTILLPTSEQIPTSHQIGIFDKAAGSQNRFEANLIVGGWHSISDEKVSGASLNNSQYSGNRFISAAGACLALEGAGVYVDGNYCNFAGSSGIPTLVCDGSCSNAGTHCLKDQPCTSCDIQGQPCVPEPYFAFIGSSGFGGSPPFTASGHNTYAKNVVFGGHPNVKQCGGTTTNAGQVCMTAGNTCAGGATCTLVSGTAKCASGTEVNVPCCTGGAPTCTARTPTPFMHIMEFNGATTHTQLLITDNTFFPGNAVGVNPDNIVGIDMVGAHARGGLTLNYATIVNNLLMGSEILNTPCTNCSAIKFPSNFAAINKVLIGNNNIVEWQAPASTGNIANWVATFGELILSNGLTFSGTGTALTTVNGTSDFFPLAAATAATTTESNVNFWVAPGAMTSWKIACSVSAAPGGGGANLRDFFLRANGVSVGSDCQIADPATTCIGTAGPGAALVNQKLNFIETATCGVPCAAANGTCTIYASIDTNW